MEVSSIPAQDLPDSGEEPQKLTAGKEDMQELLIRNHRSRDPRAREALIERFQPLARRLARRYHHSQGEGLEDLTQVATIGVIKAVDRFDPSRGVAFSSFAIPTVIGELRHHFRDATWPVHLPRKLKDQALVVERTVDRLAARDGRSPSVAEVAEAADLEVEEVNEALAALRDAKPKSLDASPPSEQEEEMTLAEVHGAEDHRYEALEYGVAVQEVLATLSERNRRVFRLRFQEDLTQSEIAARVGVSQMQVSRILRSVLDRMREAMSVEADEGV